MAFIVFACGGKSQISPFVARGDSSALFHSGTRLKAHYLDGGGGARALVAFHDTQQDVECNFLETAPGEYWCLPKLVTFTYADAACAEPTLEGRTLCPDQSVSAGMLISAGSTDCTAMYGAFSLDAPQAQIATFLLPRGLGTECEALTPEPSTKPGWTTKPVDLQRFVRGTVSIVGSPNGTRVERISTADGAFVNAELVAGSERCSGDLTRPSRLSTACTRRLITSRCNKRRRRLRRSART